MQIKPVLFLTQAPDNQPSRRRDPFGFANVAGYYADLLAPDLTNRNRDPRWLSILCWSLKQVQQDFADLSLQSDRYDRLRGLELRWVIESCRTLDAGKGRQLPGSLEVRAVHIDKSEGLSSHFWTLRERMGPAQWRRYRFTGPYASYRGLMKLLGLVEKDGWQLTKSGLALAAIAEKKSGICLKTVSIKLNKKPTDQDSGWVDYWLRRWPRGEQLPRPIAFLPTNGTKITQTEAAQIQPVLFPKDNIRSSVVRVLDGSTETTHAELCMRLQQNLLKLKDWSPNDRKRLEKLAAFAKLSDAAVEALRAAFATLAEQISGTSDASTVSGKIKPQLKAMVSACHKWQVDGIWSIVDEFAVTFKVTDTPKDALVKLVRFHESRASGLLWLKYENNKLDKAARYDRPPNGFYRFRLEALTRLAFGCDVIGTLPMFFRSPSKPSEDQNDN